MSTKFKNLLTVCLGAVFFLGFSVWCLVRTPDELSESERRPLASMPAFSMEDVASGKFMSSFESYATDQFPMRDGFRALSAVYSRYIALQKDVDGIYTYGGFVSKLSYPMDCSSLDNAAVKFRSIYDKFLYGKANNVYISVIPDKNNYMTDSGAPTIDFAEFVDYLRSNTDFAQYIDISSTLDLESYYRTDTHWRQEKLPDTAMALLSAMGCSGSGHTEGSRYVTNTVSKPFMGVYGSQSALPHRPESLCYLTNSVIDGLTVFDYEINQEIGVYDLERALGSDGYEIFLSGPRSLQKITNPAGEPGRKLVVFRDSFGSSIAPLLAEAYSEVTLVDIRYLNSEIAGRMVDFTDCDVLFLYSQLVLNNSITLK